MAQAMDVQAVEPSATLLDLSTDSIAIILAHLGTRPKLADLGKVAAVCSDFHRTLGEDSVWQTLCKYAWSICDLECDLSTDWPRLSSFRSLYAVLEVWAPRQGFHHLLNAYPWGALLLLRFRGGKFVGELIHHRPSPSNSAKCEAQEPVTILECDFEASSHAWLRAAREPAMLWCGQRVAACTTVLEAPTVLPSRVIPGSDFFREALMDSLVPDHVQCSRYLQVTLAPTIEGPAAADYRENGDDKAEAEEGGEEEEEGSDDGEEEGSEEQEEEGSSEEQESVSGVREAMRLWAPTNRGSGGDESARWWRRLQGLPNHCSGRTVTLGLVDGPPAPPSASASPPAPATATATTATVSASAVQDSAMRSGMYIGDYSHNRMYGLFGNEALLLERRSFSTQRKDLHALRTFFGRGRIRPLSEPVDNLLERLATSSPDGRCTLLVGRKVTGDFHVPMGAATFAALLEPTLDEGREAAPPPPSFAVTRGGHERVVRGWDGFGTLAYPGFGSPQWDPGWLVQLEDDEDGRRFAFVWGSRQGDSANLLHQVVAQSTAVFVGEDEKLRPYWPPATPYTPGVP